MSRYSNLRLQGSACPVVAPPDAGEEVCDEERQKRVGVRRQAKGRAGNEVHDNQHQRFVNVEDLDCIDRGMKRTRSPTNIFGTLMMTIE